MSKSNQDRKRIGKTGWLPFWNGSKFNKRLISKRVRQYNKANDELIGGWKDERKHPDIAKDILCPTCGKTLEYMSGYSDGHKVISIMYCPECADGLDREWEVTYDVKSGVEKIERYFFG